MDEHDEPIDLDPREVVFTLFGPDRFRTCAYCKGPLPEDRMKVCYYTKKIGGTVTISRYCSGEHCDRDNFEFDDSEPYRRPEA